MGHGSMARTDHAGTTSNAWELYTANLILHASASERSSARFPDHPPRAWTLPSTSLHLFFPSLLDVSYIFLTYFFFRHYPSQRHSGGTEACSPARCPRWSVQCGPELRAHYLGRVANQVKRQEPGKLVEVGVPFVFFPFLSSIKLMQQTHNFVLEKLCI